jgi:hypothetical protein
MKLPSQPIQVINTIGENHFPNKKIGQKATSITEYYCQTSPQKRGKLNEIRSVICLVVKERARLVRASFLAIIKLPDVQEITNAPANKLPIVASDHIWANADRNMPVTIMVDT